MDYLTNSITRIELRYYARIFRKLYNVEPGGKFPVMEALEQFPVIFKGSSWEVIDNEELPFSVPARCCVNSNGSFTIQIRQDTYDGAYKGIGAYRGFIIHELCHAFLYTLGFTPIMQRSFENGEICCYHSSEWQAKALCGEVMMPYEETKRMGYKEIHKRYGVSLSSAKYRCFNY